MRKIYKRQAWLLDDGILLEGYVSKRKFYPNCFGCGFSYQKIRRKDIGKILFYNVQDVLKLDGINIEEAEHEEIYNMVTERRKNDSGARYSLEEVLDKMRKLRKK